MNLHVDIATIKRYFIQVVVLVLFLMYWLITFVYNTPNNFIRIQLDQQMSLFEQLFYQKWTFFTPPGKANERIYFNYVSALDSGDVTTIEILQPIFKAKRENAPFNMEAELLDDFISNSAIGINNVLHDKYTMYKTVHPDSSQQFYSTEAMKEIRDVGLDFAPVRTLHNYAKVVANKYGIDAHNHKVSITITSKPIPEFKDRLLPYDSLQLQESLVFQSDVFQL